MAKTLTPAGIQKIAQRFVDSIDHAAYLLSGQPKTSEPFRRIADADAAKVYIYFDDTVVGEVADIKLIDSDGDVVAVAERTFTKTAGNGLYVSFKYNISELEVEEHEGI